MTNANFVEEQVTVNGKYALKGTLTIPENPKGRCPAVLLIAGSGKITRDGNAQKININIYKELAELITQLGFVSLRYDKRGVGESGGEYLETGMWDLVEDVKANIEYLKAHPSVNPDRIILLGHSEGCMLATITNAQHPVDGLVLLSGAAENLEEAVARQREFLRQEIQNSRGLKFSLLRLLKADKKSEEKSQEFFRKVMASDQAVIKQGFVKINAKWIREHFSHDVLEDLKKAACPILAVTGSKDFQTNPACLSRVPDLAKGDCETHVIANMDHILKEFHGEITVLGCKKQYKNASSQPIHPELLQILSSWLSKHYLAAETLVGKH